MLYRKFIAGVLLLSLMTAITAVTRADGQTRPVNSYPSELWRMEFRDQPKKEVEGGLPQDTSATGRGRSTTGASGMGADGYTVGSMASDSIPGQAELQDLQAETPFAEWQVDQAAKGELKRDQDIEVSAWTLSKTSGGRSLVQEEVLSDGPSPLTFLVAVVAAMVVVGAIFSGRD